jgi:hypothetical protein
MDFAFFEFLRGLQRSILSLTKTMSALANRIKDVVEYFQSGEAKLKAELATVKEELAAALADDAADESEIAAAKDDAAFARQEAEAAAAKSAELQALVDADTEEDAAIMAILDTVKVERTEPTEPAA